MANVTVKDIPSAVLCNCMFLLYFLILTVRCLQFSTCKAKGMIMWLSAEASRMCHCELLLTFVCHVTFVKSFRLSALILSFDSFVHWDIDKSDKDMRWLEQRADNISAQFTWCDEDWLKMQTIIKALFSETKICLKISWHLPETFGSVYSVYKPQLIFQKTTCAKLNKWQQLHI